VAGASFADAAFTAGSQIGRYFALVSAIPSALFVFFVYALVRSGAWTGDPDLDAVGRAVSNITLGEASLLLLLALAVGLLTHPLQYATIQLLEGYWGTTSIGRALAVARVRHHRARAFHLDQRRLDATQELAAVDTDTLERLDKLSTDVIGDPCVPAMVDELAHYRAGDSYPPQRALIMPTRLGNVLRRYEALAGEKYGLDAIPVAPHLSLVGLPAHVAYLRDAREQLDLAVRLCALCLIAATIAFAFFITDGAWVLVAAIPYALAYLCYRGALVAAHEYGTAFATLVDLDRFRLYGELHVEMPWNTAAERRANATLMELLRFYPTAETERLPYPDPTVTYEHPPDAGRSS
jgi:hypothetical protein